MVRLDWAYHGLIPYGRALKLQTDHARRVATGVGPRLFLLEHPPIVTLGRRAKASSLKLSEAEYNHRGIDLVRTSRGGDVTYHGPGQLVGYPVVSLRAVRMSIPAWVQGIAGAIVRVLSGYGIRATWSDTHPGVWVGGAKIAALGFRVSRGVSIHGFALNVQPDMNHFDTIVPCGLRQLTVTSMSELRGMVPCMHEIAGRLAEEVARSFGWTLEPESNVEFSEESTDALPSPALA